MAEETNSADTDEIIVELLKSQRSLMYTSSRYMHWMYLRFAGRDITRSRRSINCKNILRHNVSHELDWTTDGCLTSGSVVGSTASWVMPRRLLRYDGQLTGQWPHRLIVGRRRHVTFAGLQAAQLVLASNINQYRNNEISKMFIKRHHHHCRLLVFKGLHCCMI